MRFPDGFLWGAATSAHQIEGSPTADGAGPSIWDRFAATPGRVFEGHTARVACDHYRRWPEDVALMQAMGLTSYRFSVAWGRVLPEGTGAVNAAGLDHYERLVDALLAAGIAPSLTLYHWDLPAALDDRGGWLNPDVAGWMANYAATVARRLHDRVALWTTLNEPWVVMDGGYMEGHLAPGHRVYAEAPVAAHHLLCAHGAAVQALRAEGARQVGLVVNLEPKYQASDTPEDAAAVARAEAYMNRFFLDPVLLGRYPDELPAMFGAAWPARLMTTGFDRIRQPLDFVGVNYYTRAVVQGAPHVPVYGYARVAQPQHAHTEMGWEVYAEGLADTLRRLRARYAALPPLYVMENGAAFYDPPTALADPHPDPLRVAYLQDHLRALGRAIGEGVDVRGYYAWSLLDNFEWSAGFSKRFGLVHVDYATQRRTRKASSHAYAEVIRTNGASLSTH